MIFGLRQGSEVSIRRQGLPVKAAIGLAATLLLAVGGFIMVDGQRVQADSAVKITFPLREVAAEPNVATRKIVDQRDGEPEGIGNIDIPYIQTETTLSPTATANSSDVPSGGGLKFVLDDGNGHSFTLYDKTGPSPYTVSFNDLPKAEYDLDVYIVNASNVVQAGSGLHDQATNIGIGDIITAIGDSVTAGQDYYLPEVTNWTEAESQYRSNDNRNFQQPDHFGRSFHVGFTKRLNNDLSASYGYPVFIMNEGSTGMMGDSYAGYMASSVDWQNRQNDLKPNKWIIHLGINEANNGYNATQYKEGIEDIVDILLDDYDVRPTDILLAKPMYFQETDQSLLQATYLPEIDSIISQKGLTNGPDYYYNFELRNGDWYSFPFHPNLAGYDEMGRMLGISFDYPRNFTLSGTGTEVDLSWDDLSVYQSSVTGYTVKYGTSPGQYTQTVNVGDNLTTTVSGLQETEIYYFSVYANYDNTVNGHNVISQSASSAEIRHVVEGVPSVPRNITATAGVEQASVAFDAPISDGRHTISSYTVTASPGGATATGSTSPVTVTGLEDGESYTFTVHATNSQGDSAESDPSNSVTLDFVSDGAVAISLEDPESMPPGGTVTYSPTLTNNGPDPIDLSALNTNVAALMTFFYPVNDLDFVGTTNENVVCSSLGTLGNSVYDAYFENHFGYGAILCTADGDIGLLERDQSYSVNLVFDVNQNVSDEFTTYAYSVDIPDDPDLDAVNYVYNTSSDFIDGFLDAGINNVSSYTYEAATPEEGAGDANGDGLADNQQPNVQSLVNPDTGKLEALELSGNCEIDQLNSQSEDDFAKSDPGFDYPSNFMHFFAICDDSVVTVKQYLYDVSGEFSLRKYNPNLNSYFNVENVIYGSQEIDGHQVLTLSYQITDNGDLDLNKEDNLIEDPVGLGKSEVGAPNTGIDRRVR